MEHVLQFHKVGQRYRAAKPRRSDKTAFKLITYYVIIGASRIADASRVDQSLTDDGDVSGWDKADDFILGIRIYTSKGPLARAYKLQWRDTDGGSFADVASTGAISFSATTVLVDDASLAEVDKLCDAQGGYTWQAGKESEGDNILPDSGTYSLADEYYTELQWALDCGSAVDGHTYEFQLVDVTIGPAIAVCAADITMAGGAPTEVAVTFARSAGVSEVGDAVGEGTLTLPRFGGETELGTAVAEGGVSEARSAGITGVGDALAEGILTEARSAGITGVGDAVAEGAISTAKYLGSLWEGALAVYAAVLFARSAGISGSGDAVAEGALTLARSGAVVQLGDAVAGGSLSLARSLDVTLLGGAVAGGDISLVRYLGLSALYEALFEAALSLARSLGVSDVGDAVAGAAISLGLELGVVGTPEGGADVSLTINIYRGLVLVATVAGVGEPAPLFRTLVVEAEDRGFVVDLEGRTLKVSFEDRVHKAHKAV